MGKCTHFAASRKPLEIVVSVNSVRVFRQAPARALMPVISSAAFCEKDYGSLQCMVGVSALELINWARLYISALSTNVPEF